MTVFYIVILQDILSFSVNFQNFKMIFRGPGLEKNIRFLTLFYGFNFFYIDPLFQNKLAFGMRIGTISDYFYFLKS